MTRRFVVRERAWGRWLPGALGLVVVLALTSCSDGGSIDVPTPTRTGGATSLPSKTPTLPDPTRSPDEPTESETPTESASASVSTSPSDEPTQEPTETPTDEPTVSETPTQTPSEAPSKKPQDDETAAAEEPEAETPTDSGTPSWVWWLLAGVLLVIAVLAVVVPRSRRRKAWKAELASAEAEAAWFAREFLPQLQQSYSLDQVAGGWQVGAARVSALEDSLTGLEASARDENGRARARVLRDGVRTARHGVESLLVSSDSTPFARELGALAGQLSSALEPPATP